MSSEVDDDGEQGDNNNDEQPSNQEVFGETTRLVFSSPIGSIGASPLYQFSGRGIRWLDPDDYATRQQAMRAVETQLQRLPHLDKWFVDIVYPSPAVRDG